MTTEQAHELMQLQDRLQALPRPDLDGARPSSEEFQLWVGMAQDLMHALQRIARA